MSSPPGIDALLTVIRCPACHGSLGTAPRSPDDVDRLECRQCASRWPVRFGIPDLRATGVTDPYLTVEQDLSAAGYLFEHARGGFTEALSAYYATNERVPPAQARRFIAGTLAAEERSRAVLGRWQSLGVAVAEGPRTMLDVGCGTGPLLVAAQSPNVQLVGIDGGLRWLVLAAARLRDRGARAHLVCAGVQRLPFADASVDTVASESLLENVPAAEDALGEMTRVLRPHGWLYFTTANRWSVGPDPHVGLPLGGWLPDLLVAAWAKRHGMVPPRRHLLGVLALRRLLSRCGLQRIQVGPAPIAEAQLHGVPRLVRMGIHGYRLATRIAAGRAVLTAVGPSLLGVANRPWREGSSPGA